jgi:hypothetical protein
MLVLAPAGALAAAHHHRHATHHKRSYHIRKFGTLDCNGHSRAQRSLKATLI